MKKLLSLFCLLLALALAKNAFAHMLWVNLTESLSHPPGHVTSILGWGHTPPLDDLLVSGTGTISLQSYELIGPDGKATDLGLPSTQAVEPVPGAGHTLVHQGDLGLRKIALTDKTLPGAYQVAVVSKPLFFTQYLDVKGNTRVAMQPMDKVADAKQILAAMKYQSFAKSFFSIQEWTEPQPLGHELEIMPLVDMSHVHVGDMVRFQVTYRGKPVNLSPQAMRTMTCVSNAFGGPDGFQLSSYIINGVAQFRIPAAGQWVANVYYKQDVADDESLADLKDKCTTVYTAGSIGFTAEP